jgi:ABC-type Fe3+ transport system permease subunit
MNAEDIERDWAQRASRYLKAELKRADITYEELAKRLNAKGWGETAASVTNKLARGTFAATFFLAALEAIEKSGVRLEDI